VTPSLLLRALADGPLPRARLGASTAGLARALAALRAEGVQIDDDGARLHLRDPAGFGAHTLAWRVGRPVRFAASCASTNDLARAAGRAGPEPLPVVVAREQRAGRGRLQRAWQMDPERDLALSAVLRPPVAPAEAARCVLVWAAALAEALDLRLKWPNDLVDGEGGKVGGILAELELRDGAVDFVVFGLGLNLNGDRVEGQPGARTLAAVRGAPVDRAELAGAVVRALDAVPVDDLRGPAGMERWRARAHTIGRRVVVRDGPGRVIAEGLATGVRDDGALLVDGQAVLTGDVALLA
jgi:BirA family transcriptional regulator, biotin operon repressor / biotin---[acetyl-CoA-carboxylase] ligase